MANLEKIETETEYGFSCTFIELVQPKNGLSPKTCMERVTGRVLKS